MTHENQRQAEMLVNELPDEWEAWVAGVDVHYAEVCIAIPQRELPAGFLETVSQYGDLRIEGVDGETVETTVFI